MKFTALVQTTTINTVSPHRDRLRAARSTPPIGSWTEQDAAEGHDPGGDHLAAHLGQPVQLADVVDRTEQADDRRAEQHARELGTELEDLPEVGQLAGRDHRRGEPEVDRHAAEPRDRRRVDVAVAHRA